MYFYESDLEYQCIDTHTFFYDYRRNELFNQRLSLNNDDDDNKSFDNRKVYENEHVALIYIYICIFFFSLSLRRDTHQIDGHL